MSPDAADALDAELRRLHGGPDAAALTRLHESAAAAMSDPAAARFHLTHAWVYALVCGDDAQIAALESQLIAAGGLP